MTVGGAVQWENTDIDTMLKYNRKGQKLTSGDKTDQLEYEYACYAQRNYQEKKQGT